MVMYGDDSPLRLSVGNEVSSLGPRALLFIYCPQEKGLEDLMAFNKSCWPLWRIEMDALISWIVPLERPLSNPMGPQAANSIAQRTSSKTCVYCDSIICSLFFRVNQRRPQSGVQTL